MDVSTKLRKDTPVGGVYHTAAGIRPIALLLLPPRLHRPPYALLTLLCPQRLRIAAVRAIRTDLHRSVSETVPGSDDTEVQASPRAIKHLSAVAKLAKEQRLPLRLRASSWRAFNALSAVVWKRTLAAVAAKPVRLCDFVHTATHKRT